MKVRISQPNADSLVIYRGRSWRRAAALGGAMAAWGGLLWLLSFSSLASVAWWFVGLATLPIAALAGFRALRTSTSTLVRTPGRLLLDGEPLELARVELRVRQRLITRTPTGYALSLWVMSAAGPIDIPLGHFPALVDASRLSGLFEDFVQRSSVKQRSSIG